jgi:hypothetical protein
MVGASVGSSAAAYIGLSRHERRRACTPMIGSEAEATKRDKWRVRLAPRPVSVCLVFGLLLLMLVMMPGTLLLIFAGGLLAILFRTSGVYIARMLSIAPGWGVAIFLRLLSVSGHFQSGGAALGTGSERSPQPPRRT